MTIRHLRCLRMERHWRRYSKKLRKPFISCPLTGFAGNPPNPATAQSKDAAMFGWASNGDLYFGDGSNLLTNVGRRQQQNHASQ